MTDAAAQHELQKVMRWLLAILRFAVTLDPNDQAAILIMAQQMDRLGSRSAGAKFAFFARTSSEFCDVFAGSGNPEKTDALRRYVAKIDNARLRCALEAVLDADRREAGSSKS
jgi:hypothetical protein